MVLALLDQQVSGTGMDKQPNIESVLSAQLEQAIRYQEQRAREYEEVLRHVSHNHSSREDAERVQQAFLRELAARKATWRATQRLSDFENFGWIPDDLGRSPALANASHG